MARRKRRPLGDGGGGWPLSQHGFLPEDRQAKTRRALGWVHALLAIAGHGGARLVNHRRVRSHCGHGTRRPAPSWYWDSAGSESKEYQCGG